MFHLLHIDLDAAEACPLYIVPRTLVCDHHFIEAEVRFPQGKIQQAVLAEEQNSHFGMEARKIHKNPAGVRGELEGVESIAVGIGPLFQAGEGNDRSDQRFATGPVGYIAIEGNLATEGVRRQEVAYKKEKRVFHGREVSAIENYELISEQNSPKSLPCGGFNRKAATETFFRTTRISTYFFPQIRLNFVLLSIANLFMAIRWICFVLLLLSSLNSRGQSLIGDWKPYLSHSNATASVLRGNTLYCITQGGFFAYDLETGSSQVFSTVDGLSGISPSVIYYAADQDLIFIGYLDGSIDYFQELGDFNYLSDIARNTTFIGKAIKGFAAQGNRLYVATDFGLVVYDMDEKLPLTDVAQIGDNPTRQPIVSLTLFDNRIWVVLEGVGLYSAPLDAANLKDPNVWEAEAGQRGMSPITEVEDIGANSQNIYALWEGAVYSRGAGSDWEAVPDFSADFRKLYVSEEALGAIELAGVRVQYFGSMLFIPFITGGLRHMAYAAERGRMFFATATRGVVEFNNYEYAQITPGGPATNENLRLIAGNGELYVAPRGYNQAFTPIPSALGVFYYNRETGWANLDSMNKGLPKEVSTGFARAYYDQGTGKAYLGSWGRGIVELERGEWKDWYACENSGISFISEPCSPNRLDNSRVSGMDKDLYGNLWVTLDFARNPLVMQNPQGEWFQAPSSKFPSNHHIIDLAVDDYGNKWMLNAEQGLLVYNDNNTPEDFNDDRLVRLRAGLNQGGLPTNEVTSIARDLDGFIWVGTGQGVTVYYDVFSVAQGEVVDASAPIYDGRALLKDAIINGIAVDGGNRKWMATNDGVFLVSEDGNEVIYQFTVENSPLLSNEVNDVAVDQQTGEVFFGTARGIISFQGDATRGANPCEEVLVFPNPVRPDYDGPITIRGSAAESLVRITTVSGLLVKEVEAQGGTAVWDGRDLYGNYVHSGVYLAFIANRNGENGCIGKFTVIGR